MHKLCNLVFKGFTKVHSSNGGGQIIKKITLAFRIIIIIAAICIGFGLNYYNDITSFKRLKNKGIKSIMIIPYRGVSGAKIDGLETYTYNDDNPNDKNAINNIVKWLNACKFLDNNIEFRMNYGGVTAQHMLIILVNGEEIAIYSDGSYTDQVLIRGTKFRNLIRYYSPELRNFLDHETGRLYNQ